MAAHFGNWEIFLPFISLKRKISAIVREQKNAGGDKFISEINNKSFDFACLNFANPDMVGHTGDFKATVQACEKVDMELKKIVLKALKNNYQILVTADHGNAEVMINEDGSLHTYHTTNLVPLILISNNIKNGLKDGKLGDIAPTVLELMNIEKPVEMTGNSLLN